MMHTRLLLVGALIGGLGLLVPDVGSAEEKSFYSPLIAVNAEKGFILISTSAKVFPVEASAAAKPHLEKLPISGMIDIVVELRGDDPPLLKRWKVMSGETTCRVFDGKDCK
jgi:hypothetical protein